MTLKIVFLKVHAKKYMRSGTSVNVAFTFKEILTPLYESSVQNLEREMRKKVLSCFLDSVRKDTG